MEKEPKKKEVPDRTAEYIARDLVYEFPRANFSDPSELRYLIGNKIEGAISPDLLKAVQANILELNNREGKTTDGDPSDTSGVM